jgi:hypothetical protein
MPNPSGLVKTKATEGVHASFVEAGWDVRNWSTALSGLKLTVKIQG